MVDTQGIYERSKRYITYRIKRASNYNLSDEDAIDIYHGMYTQLLKVLPKIKFPAGQEEKDRVFFEMLKRGCLTLARSLWKRDRRRNMLRTQLMREIEGEVARQTEIEYQRAMTIDVRRAVRSLPGREAALAEGVLMRECSIREMAASLNMEYAHAVRLLRRVVVPKLRELLSDYAVKERLS